ncbi:hypothetical protein [Occallatibacter riparius]|uniref:Ribosome association toxin RatA n=1 Tax=Occallatibacter riparius TaxID=1002689 RepID=A0A9J7BI47_9BACT|nr:hypothetical protein [Occallatibacter riparius]UWZ82612.1 hypothetical protein MOP44_18820 [Occallatibacter riparius]
MTRTLRKLAGSAGLLLFSALPAAHAQAPSKAAADFSTYASAVESRLATEHASKNTALAAADHNRLRAGELVIQKLIPEKQADPPGAMLHDWRGTAFAPGATAADFERLLRDFPSYTSIYAPEVVRSAVVSHNTNAYSVTMRVKQKHVLTVVMDTTYDVTFSTPSRTGGWSISRSTEIREIENAGTNKERALAPKEEHGFLWRLNTYWTWEERDGGLYLQIESISLTRSIPAGLGWVARPFVESVPRESLEFTLRQTCDALKRSPQLAKGGGR